MRTSCFPLILIGCVIGCLLPGCTRYEYDITAPADRATHIGKEEVTVAREPFRYRMKVVENRLVMLIDNPTDEPFQLLGEQSSVVDPNGQSHPLRPVAMAPHSYVKLIFPPMRPTYYRSGPTFGIGVGTVIGRSEHRRHFVDDPGYFDDGGPRYLTVFDDNALYWDWNGPGEMRLNLLYQRGNADKPFGHDWVILRTKAR